jgi:hypothetical protein
MSETQSFVHQATNRHGHQFGLGSRHIEGFKLRHLTFEDRFQHPDLNPGQFVMAHGSGRSLLTPPENLLMIQPRFASIQTAFRSM